MPEPINPKIPKNPFKDPLYGGWASLIEKAYGVQKRAHAPYSSFRVGAALISKEGNVYLGANVENASYGLTICAERSAISAAVANGDTTFLAIAVVSSGVIPATPCGACRQVLFEFSEQPFYLKTASKKSKQSLFTDTHELLPFAFHSGVLKPSS